MTHEEFNKLVEELESIRIETLKTKNAKYAPADDALHNFHAGAEIMGVTTAQCIWGYATKHIVALRDKILNDNFSDMDDVLEKIQDIQNYLSFIYCAANESQMVNDIEPCIEYCNCCPEDNIEYKCTIEDRGCGCCKYFDNGVAIKEPCKSCKANFVQGTEEYKNATDNWEYMGDK